MQTIHIPRLRVRETGPGTPFKRKPPRVSKLRAAPPLPASKKYPDCVVAAVKFENARLSHQQLAYRFGIDKNVIYQWVMGSSRSSVVAKPATPEVEQWILARKAK